MSWIFNKVKEFGAIKDRLWLFTIYTFKVIYLFHFIPRLFGLTIFSGFDSKCAFYENASIFNCTQEFFVTRPKQWILYWLVSSNLSSICLYFICASRMKRMRICQACRHVSFCIIMILFFITSASFLVRIINTDSEDMPLFLALFIWWPSTMWQIIYLNNQDPVSYPLSQPQSAKGEIECRADALWFYLIYKLSLITHCLECFAFASAITLDATLALFPVAIIHGDIHGTLMINMSKIFLGIRLLFVYGICVLYLQKIFHEDRTLFAEPGGPMQLESEVTNVAESGGLMQLEIKVTNVAEPGGPKALQKVTNV